jgi:hypothetical protein
LVAFAALFVSANKLRATELPDAKYPFCTNRFHADTPIWKVMACLVWMITLGWFFGVVRFIAYAASYGGIKKKILYTHIRRPIDSSEATIFLSSHHAAFDLSLTCNRKHETFVHKKMAFLPNWFHSRRFIDTTFKKSFDTWAGDLVLAPAGVITAPGFTPKVPSFYIDRPHSSTRKIVEVKTYTPTGICMRVEGANVLSDLFWCLSQPYLTAEVLLVAEIPANEQPNITDETLREAFAKVGVKYLPEWTVKRKYGGKETNKV